MSYTLRHNRTVSGDIVLDNGIIVTLNKDAIVEVCIKAFFSHL
jgi:hypothetical protein